MNSRIGARHSCYYPRRARWYSRFWYPWHRFRRAARLDWMDLPSSLQPGDFVLSLCVPGFVLHAMGLKKTAAAVAMIYVALLFTFVGALGLAASNVAFGLMIAVHATSVALLLQRWFQPQDLRWRVGLGIVALALVGLGVYGTLRDRLLEHYFPLRVGERVVVVRHVTDATAIGPGDLVAVRLAAARVDGPVFLSDGYAIGPILAVAGDRVVFTPKAYEVNGQRRALLEYMPTSGEIIVPQKHFLIWPRLDIVNRAGPGVNVPDAVLKIAMIRDSQIVGRPCQRWFGRRQSPPP